MGPSISACWSLVRRWPCCWQFIGLVGLSLIFFRPNVPVVLSLIVYLFIIPLYAYLYARRQSRQPRWAFPIVRRAIALLWAHLGLIALQVVRCLIPLAFVIVTMHGAVNYYFEPADGSGGLWSDALDVALRALPEVYFGVQLLRVVLVRATHYALFGHPLNLRQLMRLRDILGYRAFVVCVVSALNIGIAYLGLLPFLAIDYVPAGFWSLVLAWVGWCFLAWRATQLYLVVPVVCLENRITSEDFLKGIVFSFRRALALTAAVPWSMFPVRCLEFLIVFAVWVSIGGAAWVALDLAGMPLQEDHPAWLILSLLAAVIAGSVTGVVSTTCYHACLPSEELRARMFAVRAELA